MLSVSVPLTGGKRWASSVACTAVGLGPLVKQKCTPSVGWLHELTQHKDPVFLTVIPQDRHLDLISEIRIEGA